MEQDIYSNRVLWLQNAPFAAVLPSATYLRNNISRLVTSEPAAVEEFVLAEDRKSIVLIH